MMFWKLFAACSKLDSFFGLCNHFVLVHRRHHSSSMSCIFGRKMRTQILVGNISGCCAGVHASVQQDLIAIMYSRAKSHLNIGPFSWEALTSMNLKQACGAY